MRILQPSMSYTVSEDEIEDLLVKKCTRDPINGGWISGTGAEEKDAELIILSLGQAIELCDYLNEKIHFVEGTELTHPHRKKITPDKYNEIRDAYINQSISLEDVAVKLSISEELARLIVLEWIS